MKKFSIIAIGIVLISLACSLTSSALDSFLISGVFRYTVENDEACIVGTVFDLDDDDENDVFLSLEIPSSLGGYPVTTIGEQAFKDYTILSVSFPDTITKLSEGAFYNCEGLFTVDLPNSITYIGDCCFANCIEMISLDLPDYLEKLGCAAFYNTSISEVYIPKSLSETALEYSIVGIGIGSRMGPFSLSRIQTITFEQGIESIPKGLFYGCPFLTEVYIPNSVTTIGSAAFKDCLMLKTITGMENVNKIKALAFADCIELENVSFIQNLETLESGAFLNTLKLKSFTVPKSLVNTEMDYSLVGIGNGYKTGPFRNSGLENISFENELNTIPFGLFDGCDELKILNIPDSITTIKACSFRECTSLETISGMKNVKTIKALAFTDCTNLSTLPFLENLKTLESGAFSKTINLKNFTVPKALNKCTIDYSIVGIGAGYNVGPFDNSGLKNIYFETGVTKIVFGLFSNCINLEVVNIPNTVTTLNECCFKGCTNLKTITGMENVTNIKSLAFTDCTSLCEVPTMKKLKSIGSGAFVNATSLSSFTLSSNITSVSTSYSIVGVGTGTSYPFAKTGVTKLYISSDVTKIPDNLFYSAANIKEVYLYNTIIEIGKNAFNKCSSITDVYFYGTEEEWNAISVKANNDYLLNANIHFCQEHEHMYNTEIIGATCTDEGYTIYICDCGDRYISDKTNALGHNYGIEIIKPTCTINGTATYICYCGDTYTEVIPAIGHNYEEGVCINCGDSKIDDCSCNCHKGGISGLIWKILRFFYKLFKINPVCGCGVSHY